MSEEPGAVEAAPVVEPAAPVDAPAVDAATLEVTQPANTPREAVERAFRDDTPPEPEKPPSEAPPDAESGPQRDEQGRFKAKEEGTTETKPGVPEAEPPAQPMGAAPARFSPDAQAEWDKAPKAVQAETLRMMREMEGGLQQYQQQLEPLKAYAQQAQESGTTLPEALERYTRVEALLRENPIQGLEAVVRQIDPKWTLRGLAAHLMGQTPDQNAAQSEQTIAALRSEIAELKQGFGGIRQTFQQQQEAQTTQQIEAFAAANPRFDELSGEIARMLETGYAADLQTAYQMAERLNPAPPQPQPPAAQTRTTAPPQTPKATLSVSGAPSSGSSPIRQAIPATPREALERAGFK